MQIGKYKIIKTVKKEHYKVVYSAQSDQDHVRIHEYNRPEIAEHEFRVAQNGIKALIFLKERRPDLILLDVMMPEMDGYEFCRKIKRNLSLSHIPIFFLTAKSESDDIIKGFEVGGSDYVTKPFIAAELMARIKTHLEIKQLKHLIPICSICKRVRDDEGLWRQLEHYLNQHPHTKFSHGICKECAKQYYPDIDLD